MENIGRGFIVSPKMCGKQQTTKRAKKCGASTARDCGDLNSRDQNWGQGDPCSQLNTMSSHLVSALTRMGILMTSSHERHFRNVLMMRHSPLSLQVACRRENHSSTFYSRHCSRMHSIRQYPSEDTPFETVVKYRPSHQKPSKTFQPMRNHVVGLKRPHNSSPNTL